MVKSTDLFQDWTTEFNITYLQCNNITRRQQNDVYGEYKKNPAIKTLSEKARHDMMLPMALGHTIDPA